jgi:hypothetical protein
MPILDDLKAFNVPASTLSLWAFKKSGAAGVVPTFTGRWIETTDGLDAALKSTVSASIADLEETLEYGLLAENNEASALTIDSVETHAGLITDASGAETDQLKVTTLKHIRNAKFVAIKLTHGDNVLYAMSRTNSSWQTKAAKSCIPVVFSDERLTLNEDPSFDIPKSVDFFVLSDKVLIQHKRHFESLLNFSEAHQADFTELQEEPEFLSAFSDIAPIVAHVGTNRIHLRRACAIKSKGHYKDAAFMARLRARHAEFGLALQFDGEGKIVPTPETIRDVFIALLDHRLASGFSTKIYDVPNTVPILVP